MSSIQDFLVANLFRLDEEHNEFVRGPERISFDDLAGKPLAYFQARYELNELDRDLIDAETPDASVSPEQANVYVHARLEELRREIIHSTTEEELSQAWNIMRETRAQIINIAKSRSEMTLHGRVAFVQRYGVRAYLNLPE